MKTAEQVLKSKLDHKVAVLNSPDYTFNKVIEAMEEYKEQSPIDLKSIRDDFFKECVENGKVLLAPHDLFEWFSKRLSPKYKSQHQNNSKQNPA